MRKPMTDKQFTALDNAPAWEEYSRGGLDDVIDELRASRAVVEAAKDRCQTCIDECSHCRLNQALRDGGYLKERETK